MNFAFSEEQEMLRATARRFLDEEGSLDGRTQAHGDRRGFRSCPLGRNRRPGVAGDGDPRAIRRRRFHLPRTGHLDGGDGALAVPVAVPVVRGARRRPHPDGRDRGSEDGAAPGYCQWRAHRPRPIGGVGPVGCDRYRDGCQARRWRSHHLRNQVVRARWSHLRHPARRGPHRRGVAGEQGVSLVVVDGTRGCHSSSPRDHGHDPQASRDRLR